MYRKLAYVFAMTVVCGLSVAQAADWDRAVYWDARCGTGWADNASSILVRDGCVAAGYTLLDADQLKTWMTGHIGDKALSVVVFARDIAPDTVVETVDKNCTLRKYLDAGGKIVFYADIPFYNIAHTDNTLLSPNPATGGQDAILGIGTNLVWDSYNQVTITGLGAACGLTTTWASQRAMPIATVSAALATDNSGNAAAWVKYFVPGDYYRGFIRLYDTTGHPPVEDIIRVAEYRGLEAYAPVPADGAVDVTMPIFQWTASAIASKQDVYFGTNPQPGQAEFKARQSAGQSVSVQSVLEPGATYYWRVDTIEADGTMHPGKVWSFTAMPLTAHFPSPSDGALWRATGTKLGWAAGQGAVSHTVFFGTDKAAVAAGDTSVAKGTLDIDVTTFDPNGLVAATAYYWRVDETEADGVTVHPGAVWSFSTIDPNGGAVAQYWDNMALRGTPKVVKNVAEINFDWGGDATPGTNSPDVNIPVDGFSCRWTAELQVPVTGTYKLYEASDDGSRLFLNGKQVAAGWYDRGTTEDATGNLELVAGQRYQVVMEMYENGGGATAFLRWSGPGFGKEIIPQGALALPTMAFSPSPSNGATKVAQDAVLGWYAGKTAAQHALYLGTDPNLVAAGDASVSLGTKSETSFTPAATFDPNATYYWKVDEVAADGTVIPGIVWSFTTRDAAVVPQDVTTPGDIVQGVPNDGDWPGAEIPAKIIDDSANTKFLHFKGGQLATGFQVTPALGATVVRALTFTTANDAPDRDPVKFELSGSNDSINGPWTLIASGDIVDFAQAAEWPRFTKNTTPITFENDVPYAHYQVLFPALRNPASSTLMQVAEVELIGLPANFADGFEAYAAGSNVHGQGGWKGWQGDAGATGRASNKYAYSGANSLEILSSSDFVHEFSAAGGTWVFMAMQYCPSGSTGKTMCVLMNQYTDNNTLMDWSVQDEFDLGAGVIVGTTTKIVFNKWVEVKYVIDLDKNTVNKYYDGQFFGTAQWDDSAHGTFQAVDLYGNGASSVYYDEVALVSR